MKRWATLPLVVILASCQTTRELPPNASIQVYQNEVVSRMNVVWRRLASKRIDQLALGTVKVEFRVEPSGTFSHFRVVSNSGNHALADVARWTVEQTRVPPIPAAVLAQLRRGYMPCDCKFTVYADR